MTNDERDFWTKQREWEGRLRPLFHVIAIIGPAGVLLWLGKPWLALLGVILAAAVLFIANTYYSSS